MQPGYVRYITLIGNDPFTDWSLIILATVLMVITMIGIGSYVYVDTQNQLGAQEKISVPVEQTTHFDANKLKQVINAFDARAGERVLLGRGYVGPKDPSLP